MSWVLLAIALVLITVAIIGLIIHTYTKEQETKRYYDEINERRTKDKTTRHP